LNLRLWRQPNLFEQDFRLTPHYKLTTWEFKPLQCVINGIWYLGASHVTILRCDLQAVCLRRPSIYSGRCN